MPARRRAAATRSKSRSRKSKTSKRKKAPARKRPAPRKRTAATRKARKKVRKPSAPSLDALARKIVRATQADPASINVADYYAEDVVSQEPAGEPIRGLAGMEAKSRAWESIQDSRAAKWKAQKVFTGGNRICIEWEAELQMSDGRRVTFNEVAVHEVRGSKIVAERYYYDPASLAPPAPSTRTSPAESS